MEKIATEGAPKATGPFSQAIVAGNLIFTSGQIHLSPDGKLLEGTIEEQTRRVMENLKAVLAGAGASFENVVKATIYVTDMAAYPAVNRTYGEFFAGSFPAREVVCVKELPLGAKIEISIVAVKE